MKHPVFEVVDEMVCYDNGCNPLTLKWVDKMKGEKCCSKLVCREIKRAKNKDEQLGPEDVVSPMPPSVVLRMLVSTMMTGHDDGNHTDHNNAFIKELGLEAHDLALLETSVASASSVTSRGLQARLLKSVCTCGVVSVSTKTICDPLIRL